MKPFWSMLLSLTFCSQKIWTFLRPWPLYWSKEAPTPPPPPNKEKASLSHASQVHIEFKQNWIKGLKDHFFFYFSQYSIYWDSPGLSHHLKSIFFLHYFSPETCNASYRCLIQEWGKRNKGITRYSRLLTSLPWNHSHPLYYGQDIQQQYPPLLASLLAGQHQHYRTRLIVSRNPLMLWDPLHWVHLLLHLQLKINIKYIWWQVSNWVLYCLKLHPSGEFGKPVMRIHTLS